MKQLKNLTILLTFLSLVAFISCGNEGSTGSDGGDNSGENGTSGNGTTSGSEGQTVSASYVGIWYDSSDDTKIMTINSDGSITIDGIGKVTNIEKKSDTNFIMKYNEKQNLGGTEVSVTITYDIKFSSYTSGTIVVTSSATIGSIGGSTPSSETINIVKK